MNTANPKRSAFSDHRDAVRLLWAILLALLLPTPSLALEVIPGAAGFGMSTEAGRGGRLMRVTRLDDSGRGTLRDCVEAIGPRVCAFEVSGTIHLHEPLILSSPFITIAGQTAPSPGITIGDGHGLHVSTHDVLIQHLRVRPGDNPDGEEPDSRDGISVASWWGDPYNIILDHISVSWGIDENVSIRDARDVTLRNSIISEALHCSTHSKGCRSYGMLLTGDTQNVAILDNLLAHNRHRNPTINKRPQSILVAGNLIYNSGSDPSNRMNIRDLDSRGAIGDISFFGNQFIPGPSSGSAHNTLRVEVERAETALDELVFSLFNHCPLGLNSSCDLYKNGQQTTELQPHLKRLNTYLRTGFGFNWGSRLNLHQNLAEIGARPRDRDRVDARIAADVIGKRGAFVDSPQEVGGLPGLRPNRHRLELIGLPQQLDVDHDGDGYTNLENWLHRLDCDVGGNC